MARLVPPGSTVNMGIEDPLDKLTKTIDLVTKVGSFLQTSADRKSQNHMQDLESAMNMMNQGSQFLNVETAEKFQNQINVITEEAMNSGDSTLQMASEIANNVAEGAVNTANNFNAAYMSFGELKNDPIFNIKNYTTIGEDGKSTLNKKFISEINNMGADKWNNYVTQIASLKTQLFNQGENNTLVPKIKNHKGAQNIESEWNTVQNMWLNLRDSADMNDQISNEEFKYMISKGGLTNKELDSLREDIVSREEKNIGNYSRNISQSSNAILSLTQKKDKTIRDLIEDESEEGNFILQAISQSSLQQIGDIPIGELEVGGKLDEYGDFQTGPEGAQQLYEKLLQDLKVSKSGYASLQERSINRFDFWSPTSWDAEIGGMETDGSGSGIKYKGEPSAKIITQKSYMDADGDSLIDSEDPEPLIPESSKDSSNKNIFTLEELGLDKETETKLKTETTKIKEIENQEKEEKAKTGETFSEYYPSGTIDFITNNYGKLSTAGAATAAIYYSEKVLDGANQLAAAYRVPSKVIEDLLTSDSPAVKAYQNNLMKYNNQIAKLSTSKALKSQQELIKISEKALLQMYPNDPNKVSLQNKIDKMKNKAKTIKDNVVKKNKAKINQIKNSQKGRGETFIKAYAKKMGANVDDVSRLLGVGKGPVTLPDAKIINLLQTKLKFSNHFGKTFNAVAGGISSGLSTSTALASKGYLPFRLGQIGGQALGMGDTFADQMIQGGAGVGTSIAFKKFLEKKAPSILKKTALQIAPSTSRAIAIYAAEKFAPRVAARIATSLGATAASGPGAPIVATVATLINAGLLAYDVSDLAYTLYKNKEITDDERAFMIQMAQQYSVYKDFENPGLPSNPLQEPIESTRFPDKQLNKQEVRNLLNSLIEGKTETELNK